MARRFVSRGCTRARPLVGGGLVAKLNISSVMPRQLSLETRSPSFEVDGVTHRRACECPRCEAGYGPSDAERARAALRWDEQRARQAAERMLLRRQERKRAKAMTTAAAFAADEA